VYRISSARGESAVGQEKKAGSPRALIHISETCSLRAANQ
jgi:hypothetical protein